MSFLRRSSAARRMQHQAKRSFSESTNIKGDTRTPCYECTSWCRTELTRSRGILVKTSKLVNILEDDMGDLAMDAVGNDFVARLSFKPFEIKTVKLVLEHAESGGVLGAIRKAL